MALEKPPVYVRFIDRLVGRDTYNLARALAYTARRQGVSAFEAITNALYAPTALSLISP
jgi:hypothetical protein